MGVKDLSQDIQGADNLLHKLACGKDYIQNIARPVRAVIEPSGSWRRITVLGGTC